MAQLSAHADYRGFLFGLLVETCPIEGTDLSGIDFVLIAQG
jgi:hypothetical protein